MTAIGSFLHRFAGLISAAGLTLLLLYASRFWIWRAPWGNDGLFGFKLFHPLGNVVHRWVQGTPFAEMSLVVWGCGAIIFLSILQWLVCRVVK